VIGLPEFFTAINRQHPTQIESALLPYLDSLAAADYELYGKERSLIVVRYD
jgi:hypothetical protein